jgi:hypothetical protein
MREQFPWFLDPTEDELQRLWEEATFAFDANVLLNLYRVDRETTEDYFKIFRALNGRIFLPHEAAHQFFQNRRNVIRTEQNSFSKAKEEVEKWGERRKVFNNIKDQLRGGDIGQIIADEIESVFEGREDYEGKVEAVKKDLVRRIEDLEERFTPTETTRANAEEDEILDKLMEIFEGKTGSVLEEDMGDLREEAQERYESKQPPGYEDYEGGDMSRGECEDFLIWKQLMDFAKRESEDVVFITGEEKEDWWEKDDDHNIIRPRHELLREFSRKTGQTCWTLTTERMVMSAEERLEVYVRDKSVEQIGKTKKEDEIFSNKSVSKTGRAYALRYLSDEIKRGIENIKKVEKHIRHGDNKKSLREAYKIQKVMKENLKMSDEASEWIEKGEIEKEFEEKLEILITNISKDDIKYTKSKSKELRNYVKEVYKLIRQEADELSHSLMPSVAY